MKQFKIFILLLVPFLAGCFSRDKMQAINILKELARERSIQGKIIKEQEEKFALLLEAIENERLEKGLNQKRIIELYGQPLLIKKLAGEADKTVCIYAQPVDYLDKEKVYLYFKDKKLVSWEMKGGR